MIAICSNTSVYVGVTIFALCGHFGVLIVSRLPGSCQPLESDYSSRSRAPRSSAHKGLACCVMESNMIAYCSNKSAYVGVKIFASCCALPDLILPSLHLHGGVYFNTFLGMLAMSAFALGL